MANSVDSNADCTRLVVDGWLELCLKEGEGALKVLATALTLRADWERLLQAQLRQGEAGVLVGAGMSRRDLEKLSESLVRFLLYTEVATATARPSERPPRGVSVCVCDIRCLVTIFSSAPGQLQPEEAHRPPDHHPVHRAPGPVRAGGNAGSKPPVPWSGSQA